MPVCYIFNDRGDRLIRFNADEREYGRKITIGRSSENNICTAKFPDLYVSRNHFILFTNGKNWYVQDNNSRWGIRSNGRKIKNQQLSFGDIIRFSHMFLGFGEKSGPASFDIVWQIEGDPEEYRRALWPGKNTIGSSVDNSVTITDGDGVSRYHAVIEVLNQKHLTIYKDHDTALVSVNGKPIGASAELSAGDRITLGKMVLKVVARTRWDGEATLNLSKPNQVKKITGSGRVTGPEYEQAEYRTKIIYGIVAGVIICGLGALIGIILTLF